MITSRLIQQIIMHFDPANNNTFKPNLINFFGKNIFTFDNPVEQDFLGPFTIGQ